MKRFLSLLALVLFSTVARGATQTFYQASSFQTNVFLHDSPIALHLRLAGFLTNEPSWAASSNAVGIMITNYFPLPSGLALSNSVSGLTNDVAVLKTNTATAAQGALADSALQAETDPVWAGWLSTNGTPLTAADVAPIGLLASNALTQADGAALGLLGTNALPKAGGTMTGPLTNLYGYFGDGAGLTNLMSDPSAWSGFAATQQIEWVQTELLPNTNILILSVIDAISPTNVMADPVYYRADDIEFTNSFYPDVFVTFASQNRWTVVDLVSSSCWENASSDPTGAFASTDWGAGSTGSLSGAFGTLTNLYTWRAGYSASNDCWQLSRNGVVLQSWYPGSNVLSGPVVIGGVARETWPSEDSDTAIRADLSAVSHQAAAGSNPAYALSGNLSIVSNQAAAGSNLAYDVSVNLDTVSNWAVAGSNLAALALPTTGGTVTGNVTLAGSGDLTATNLYLPRFGTVYFGTTNYIRDQGSNLLFHFNTNEAIFNW